MLYCDASKTAWGGTLLKDGRHFESRDYWVDNSQDINNLEARALQTRSSRLNIIVAHLGWMYTLIVLF